MRILAIDDTKTLLSLLSMTLRNAGHEVAEAENGEEGLARFDQFKPDLVITDLNMPNMDGLTMVEKIRGELGNTTVNVIMLTTESSPSMKERGKAAGIKGWIVKPFNGPAVLESLKKLAA